MIRHQPRSTRTARLFPYTTLCLSVGNQVAVHRPARARLEGLDVDESAVATAARRGEAIALVVVPGRDAPGQSHGEDFPRIFPPFPIEVNLAPFLNGEHPIPLDRKSTRLNSSH